MTKPTARERIERAFHVSFKTPEQAAELLDAYRDENRREAAAEQRAALLSEGYDLSCRCDGCTACLVRYAICAIDPGSDYYEDAE